MEETQLVNGVNTFPNFYSILGSAVPGSISLR